MSVDQEGFIAVVGNRPFQDEFRPVIEDVQSRLSPNAFPLVHSVYLYGSVAAGRAIPGRSDLDISIILRKQPINQEKTLIEEVRRQIESAHTVVSKIDFDIGSLSEISSADPSMAWRYWLRHHCRCVAGEDLAEGIMLFRPSRTLALAVNGDFEHVLRKYRNALLSARSEKAALRLIKESSRKLIRSTNVLRSEADLSWPESLEEYAVNFENLFPMHGDELHYFLEQAKKPEADPVSFARRMQPFVDWMAGAVRDQSFPGN